MELLIAGITENREKISGPIGSSDDITNWRGITCNGDHDVIAVNGFNQHLKGTIDLEWLPPTTENVDLGCNYLSGTLDLENLPDVLTKLLLYGNKFVGVSRMPTFPW
eukprot:CAMPEP_0201518728 /NCGR_PEP_ID=MMETSP0161_2-20130828/9490_1 /ASSEMBLY_ACC=CAM_ASM_000251 /TAXON_ID=180227 /ORGANISM="Neoparamoeba aestuarina, Strain SoJaBio B1-5/56/2" /LENGTH=106 /DNA_ID=CAMNT_0047916577 /DNA_START=116 /DNA_END=433 /DNA_ORIENTATION=+